MGGLGWGNPFPLEFGGDLTNVERIYRAMRAAVGQGGSASDDENTIDGVWRQARAAGLAAAASSGERAVVNAFPDHATDLLPYFEQLFGLIPDDESDLPARRAAARARYVAEIQSAVPQIAADLVAIDPRFSVLDIDHAQSIETILGRAFEDYLGATPFRGGRKSTLFPNFSTEFITDVLLDLGSGNAPSPADDAVMQQAVDYLNTVLATWVNLNVITADGFVLDESLLDITGL